MSLSYPDPQRLENDEIRLVRILPGAWTDEIRCELVRKSLKHVGSYYALSYVWGSKNVTRRITLDGQRYSVTVNLESALRHLRCQIGDIRLWIDALCIDQSSNQERTHQVGLMKDIYELSKSTLVYLGNGIDRRSYAIESATVQTAPPVTTFCSFEHGSSWMSDSIQVDRIVIPHLPTKPSQDRRMHATIEVFTLIKMLASTEHFRDLPVFRGAKRDQNAQKFLSCLLENLRKLLHRPFTPWWSRVWVLQEVVVPHNVTMICGTVSAPWRTFHEAGSGIHLHLKSCCQSLLKILPQDDYNVLHSFDQQVLSIARLRGAYHSSVDETELCSLLRVQSMPTVRSLTTVLRDYRNRYASDPRDKVYALLSLVRFDPLRSRIVPDYDMEVPKVYTLAAIECIYSTASLEILGIDTARKSRQDLPSWVPDWEAPGDFNFNLRFYSWSEYDACADTPIDQTTVNFDSGCLILNGRYVDVVAQVGMGMLSDSSDTIRNTIANWYDAISSSADIHAIRLNKRIFWKLLCAGILYLKQRTSDIFQRVHDDDESIFHTWVMGDGGYTFLENLIDKDSRSILEVSTWHAWLTFKQSVLDNNGEQTGFLFQELSQCETTRQEIFDAAQLLSKINNDEYYREFVTQDIDALIIKETYGENSHAITKPSDISDLKTKYQSLQVDAWKNTDWTPFPKTIESMLPETNLHKRFGLMRNQVQISTFQRSIILATKFRRMFFVGNGRIGLGPLSMKTGDLLFLLAGARTPFILRKSATAVQDCYTVVGDCYIYGLMYSNEIEENIGSNAGSWEKVRLV